MWFADGPPSPKTVGTVPGTGLRYFAEPNDGRHIWAVSEQPMASQQRDFDDEFVIMPDALLNAEGYRLGQVADVTLPDELTSVVERGPDVLNHTMHPLAPALMTITDEHVLAVRRTFAGLAVYVTLFKERWIIAICPRGAKPHLITATDAN